MEYDLVIRLNSLELKIDVLLKKLAPEALEIPKEEKEEKK